MTRLCVVGPMRGYAHYNAPAFEAAASRLRAAGYEVVSPVELDRAAGFCFETDTATSEQVAAFQAAALREIDTADGLAMIEGWERSRGAAKEVEKARGLGLPFETVEAWVGLKERKGG